jgi:Ankyrin repeats (many copies)
MAEALPPRPNLEWLRKTARQQLKEKRAQQPDAKLADVQLVLARRFGFTSWRALKAHIESQQRRVSTDGEQLNEADVAAFLRAVGDGQLDVVRSSLMRNPQLVNVVGPHPYWGGRPQALHVSIETSRRDMFDMLLAAGADVNGSNDAYDQWSPLMETIHWNHADMQRELLARGAKVGLVEALLMGDDALVASILRRTPDTSRYKPNGGSVLAMARTPFAIDRLLELGVPRDVKDRWGTSPIEAMSRLGARGLPLVRHLVSKGVEASPQDYARMGDRKSLERLREANPAIVRSDDVFCGAVDFSHYDLVEWLLAQGANVNARSSIGSKHTPLHSAAWEGNLRMAKILVAAGADPRLTDREHNGTPAHWARVAITVTNNPECREVAEYLESLQPAE